jgi:hypothetical protein
MLITEAQLRKVVREMILEADDPEQVAAGAAAAGAVAARAEKRISPGMLAEFTQFIADVLAGKVIVTKGRNSINHNLFVGAFLSRYYAMYPESVGGTKFLAMIGAGTSYPEAAVKHFQKMLGLQADGDFGRQTMASLASGGVVKISPTASKALKEDERFRKLMAMIISLTTNDVLPSAAQEIRLKEALARIQSEEPYAAATDIGSKKGSTAALPDARDVNLQQAYGPRP